MARASRKVGAVLALGEAQKVPSWSETVRRPQDEDTAKWIPLPVALWSRNAYGPVLSGGGTPLDEALSRLVGEWF